MNRTIVSASDVTLARESRQALIDDQAHGIGVLDAIVLGDNAVSVPSKDKYVDRLIKYIPPDVIAAFIALEGTLATAMGPSGSPPRRDLMAASWVVFAIILVATPFYLRKLGGITKWPQIGISTIAFVVWSFAYSGPPFNMLSLPAVYGTLLIGIYTFLIPLVEV